MKVAVEYTLADYYHANKLHFVRSKSQYVILVFGLVFAILGVLFILQDNRVSIAVGIFELLVGAYFLTYAYIPLWIKTRYAFWRAPGFRAPHIFEINESGVKVDTPGRASGSYYWKSFVRARQNAKVLLLYVSDRNFLVFPRRFFSDGEWQQCVATIRSQVPQA